MRCASTQAAAPAKTTPGPTAAPSTTAPTGNTGLTNDQLTAAVASAITSASGVYVKGQIKTTTGFTIGMNAQLNADGTSEGTTDYRGIEIPFKSYNGNFYMQITSTVRDLMNDTFSTSDFNTVSSNDWVMVPESRGALTTFDAVPMGVQTVLLQDLPGTIYSTFTMNLTSGPDSYAATADGTGRLNGQSVAKYTVGNKTVGYATLYVPTTGAALPIEETGSGNAGGVMTFSWNKSTSVTLPPAGETDSVS